MQRELFRHQQKELMELARRKAGIRLPDTLHATVAEFLMDMQESEGISFSDCMHRMETDPLTLRRFIEVITIGETYFFREEKQFRIIQERLFPELFATPGKEVQLWSAACASGEEAWSLAMLAREFTLDKPGQSFRVWASDINESSLAICKDRSYGQGALRTDGSWFHQLTGKYLASNKTNQWIVDGSLAGHVNFCHMNLADTSFSGLPETLDLVMLRNVLIYLDTDVRERLVDAIVERLSVPGYLFLSATEVPLFAPLKANLMERDGVYFFSRRPDAEFARPHVHSHVHSHASRPGKTSLQSTKDHGAKPVQRKRPEIIPVPQDVEEHTAKKAPETLLMNLVGCFELINGDGLEEARQRLADQTLAGTGPGGDLRAVHFFLLAYADMREGLAAKAVINFTRCLELRPGYWLARYHKALLNAVHNPQAASRDFQRVIHDIQANPDSPPTDLRIFLEGFSPRYFLGICEKWMKKPGFQGE